MLQLKLKIIEIGLAVRKKIRIVVRFNFWWCVNFQSHVDLFIYLEKLW